MSLDVYLNGDSYEQKCICPNCDDEHTYTSTETLYSANITHNLNTTAGEAGIYEALWRPEELKITKAAELIPLLEKGLEKLKADPDKFKEFNPDNGWGDYDGLVEFVERYLAACKEYPQADVDTWR